MHTGGGRFYDPALGRPLQPNAFGGIPTVPQSLNRYGATSMGAPGVAEGVLNGIGALAPIAISRGYGLGVGLANEAGFFGKGIFGASYELRVSHLSPPLSFAPNGLPHVESLGSGWQRIGPGLYRLGSDNADVLNEVWVIEALRRHADPESKIRFLAHKAPGIGLFDPLDGPGFYGKGILNKLGLLDLGVASFLTIGTEIAFGSYWDDPYLDRTQKAGQFGVAVFGTLVSWGVVAGVGFMVGGSLGSGASLLVGGVTELIWTFSVGPVLNSTAGFDLRERRLKPLAAS